MADLYSRFMLIENQIVDAIRFFHIDAMAPVVQLHVEVYLPVTLTASSLCTKLSTRRPTSAFNKGGP